MFGVWVGVWGWFRVLGYGVISWVRLILGYGEDACGQLGWIPVGKLCILVYLEG